MNTTKRKVPVDIDSNTATAISIPFESAEKEHIIIPIPIPIGELRENTSIDIAGFCSSQQGNVPAGLQMVLVEVALW